MTLAYEDGAVVRTDGEVVRARMRIYEDGTVHFLHECGYGPVGEISAAQEGTMWARGEWDSVDVVALRALAGLARSR